MEVTSPMKPSTNTNGGNTARVDSTGPKVEKKVKTRVHLKKIAREHGKNKSPQSEAELLIVGRKGGGGESSYLMKRRKSLCRKGDAQQLTQTILSLRRDRRLLQRSIAKCHESHKLELPGTWEPPVS